MIGENFKSDTKSVSDLFSGKLLDVPDYQRSYSWTRENWEDLWKDMHEGLRTDTVHYWGTVTLMRSDGHAPFSPEEGVQLSRFEIVDGQQRLTTLYLLLLAFYRSGVEIPALTQKILQTNGTPKLQLGGPNKAFLNDFLDNPDVEPDCRTNRLIRDAYEFYFNRLQQYEQADRRQLCVYLLGSTFGLEFRVPSEDLAIRAFESLNDRGKALTLVDKTKSFLMFWALRYLDEDIKERIKSTFGKVYLAYDALKERADDLNIVYLRRHLPEDDLLIMMYHYVGRYLSDRFGLQDVANYDYDATPNDVFDRLIKGGCDHLKNRPEQLQAFVREILSALESVTLALSDLVEAAATEDEERNLLVFLGPQARTYHLLVALKAGGVLTRDVLRAVESLDVRVYKVRNTDPRARLYRDTISRVRGGLNSEEILSNIREFTRSFMSDNLLKEKLFLTIDRNVPAKYILWEYQKHQHPDACSELDADLYGTLEIEHILPRESTELATGLGFGSEEDYKSESDRLGNYCLLEKPLNAAAGQKAPHAKVEYYERSAMPRTQELAHRIAAHGYNREAVEDETIKIAEFCVERWS